MTEYGDEASRKNLHSYLSEGGILTYNNGDPELFNPLAKSIFESVKTLSQRHLLHDPDDVDIYRSLAKQPVKMVKEVQHLFCRSNDRIVGGKIHDLVITPMGEFSSNSGDAP